MSGDREVGEGLPPRWVRVCVAGGGVSWVLAEVLRMMAGRVPDAAAVGRWVAVHLAVLRGANELTMLALVLVMAGMASWTGRPRAAVGLARALGLAGAGLAVVCLVLLVLVEGRLVYPMPGLPLGGGAMSLVVSLWLAARHMVGLGCALAVAAFTLAHGVGRGRSGGFVGLGVVTVACQVIGAFPWLCPSWVPVAASILLAGWFWSAVSCRESCPVPLDEWNGHQNPLPSPVEVSRLRGHELGVVLNT